MTLNLDGHSSGLSTTSSSHPNLSRTQSARILARRGKMFSLSFLRIDDFFNNLPLFISKVGRVSFRNFN